MPADEYEPLRACLRAKQAWERSPAFHAQPQLSLFEDSRFSLLERIKGERADRRRKRKQKASQP
jgi:hypothetical protein